jgi:DNA-binding transcriptional ArsR family regulator
MRVLTSLRKGPRNVSQIIRETGLEQTYVSHCLRALEGSGFVTVEKSGKYRIYTLNKKTIEPLLALIDRHARTLAREVS